jgi:hypothetical protein
MDAPVTLQLDYAIPSPRRPVRVLALIGIAATTVLAGTLMGVGTNAINGAVSPAYFVSVMGWPPGPNVWGQSIQQGVLEGTAVGLLSSAILTTTIGIITRATCTLGMGLGWLAWIILCDAGLWLAGGIAGVLLASSFPHFFRDVFIGVPSDFHQMLRYAWVGGSIWGAELGGLLTIVVGLILFWRSWQRMLRRQIPVLKCSHPGMANFAPGHVFVASEA